MEEVKNADGEFSFCFVFLLFGQKKNDGNTQAKTNGIYKKKKGIYHRHPIFINLKSNTMKNTVQRYIFCVI